MKFTEHEVYQLIEMAFVEGFSMYAQEKDLNECLEQSEALAKFNDTIQVNNSAQYEDEEPTFGDIFKPDTEASMNATFNMVDELLEQRTGRRIGGRK